MLEGKWSRPEKTTQNVEEFTDSQKRALRAMFQECLAEEEAKNGVRHDRDQANLKKVKAVLEEIKLPSDLIEEVLSIVSTRKKKIIKVFDLGGAFVYLDKDTGHYDVSTDYNLAKTKNNGTRIKSVPAVYRNNILYGIIRVD